MGMAIVRDMSRVRIASRENSLLRPTNDSFAAFTACSQDAYERPNISHGIVLHYKR